MKKFAIIITSVSVVVMLLLFLFLYRHIERKDEFTLDQSITYKFDNTLINQSISSYLPTYAPNSQVITAGVSYAGTSGLLHYEFGLIFTIENLSGVSIPVHPDEPLIVDSDNDNFNISVDLVGAFFDDHNEIVHEVVVLENLEFSGVLYLSGTNVIVWNGIEIPAPEGEIFPRVGLRPDEYTLTCVLDFEMFANLFGGSYEILRVSRPVIWEDDGYQFGDVLDAIISIFVSYPSWVLKHVNLPVELLGGFI